MSICDNITQLCLFVTSDSPCSDARSLYVLKFAHFLTVSALGTDVAHRQSPRQEKSPRESGLFRAALLGKREGTTGSPQGGVPSWSICLAFAK